MEQNVLTLSKLKYRMGDGERTFELDVPELQIRQSTCLAVVGPSGSGKTTLLEILAMARAPQSAGRFLLESHEHGAIDIGNSWDRADDRALNFARSGLVGYAPQRGGYFPAISVLENALLRSDIAKQSRSDAARRIDALIDSLELSAREIAVKPDRLSAGQRQRTLLLNALVHQPRLVIADEPVAALHPTLAKKVMQFLGSWCRRTGSAVVMATHDLDLVEELGFDVLDGLTDVREERTRTRFERR